MADGCEGAKPIRYRRGTQVCAEHGDVDDLYACGQPISFSGARSIGRVRELTAG